MSWKSFRWGENSEKVFRIRLPVWTASVSAKLKVTKELRQHQNCSRGQTTRTTTTNSINCPGLSRGEYVFCTLGNDDRRIFHSLMSCRVNVNFFLRWPLYKTFQNSTIYVTNNLKWKKGPNYLAVTLQEPCQQWTFSIWHYAILSTNKFVNEWLQRALDRGNSENSHSERRVTWQLNSTVTIWEHLNVQLW